MKVMHFNSMVSTAFNKTKKLKKPCSEMGNKINQHQQLKFERNIQIPIEI